MPRGGSSPRRPPPRQDRQLPGRVCDQRGVLHDFRELVRPWQDRASVKELDERLALI
jgi:hypothetical protein